MLSSAVVNGVSFNLGVDAGQYAPIGNHSGSEGSSCRALT